MFSISRSRDILKNSSIVGYNKGFSAHHSLAVMIEMVKKALNATKAFYCLPHNLRFI